MEARKLIKFGNSSHVLSLPHEWLKENNLNKGDLVYLSKNGNNELIVSPERKEVKKELKVKVIDIDGKDKDRIRREVVSAYLNDINIIKLNGKEVGEKMIQIREIIHDLMALEIFEQNKNNVVARDFLNLENISIKKLIHKMDILTRSMFSEIDFNIKKEKCDNIIDRDREINRVFFLTRRAIKASLMDVDLLKKLNYTYNDLFYYWNIIYPIESIADKLKGLCWFFTNLKQKDERLQKPIFELYKKIEKYYNDAMKTFYLKDVEKAYKLSCIKHDLQDECDQFLKKKDLDRISIRIMDKLKTIIIKIHDIIREVNNSYY